MNHSQIKNKQISEYYGAKKTELVPSKFTSHINSSFELACEQVFERSITFLYWHHLFAICRRAYMDEASYA